MDRETVSGFLDLHHTVDLISVIDFFETAFQEHLKVYNVFLVDVRWEVEGGFHIFFNICLWDSGAVCLVVNIVGYHIVAQVPSEKLVLQIKLSIIWSINVCLIPALEASFNDARVCVLNIHKFESLSALR